MIPGSLASTTIRKTRGEYTIDQSIRFNGNDSAYLIRTPSGDGNLKTFTINLWIKISTINKDKFILEAFAGSGTGEFLVIASTNKIQFYGDSSGANFNITTTQLFRDQNAWAMLTAAVDTTQATASNRIKLYYNGEQITSFSTASYPTLDRTFASLNKGSVAQNIGRYGAAGSGYYDGYMAEIHFIDGTALDPSSFGKYNADGVWVPKKYAGTYGTNGFYITGADSADLGADDSGNGNDFTSSGLTAADQVTDSPTDNFPTLNPLVVTNNTTLSDGNLVQTVSSAVGRTSRATIAIPEGKWVYEYTLVDTNDRFTIWGICRDDTTSDEAPGTSATSYAFYVVNGNKRNNTAGGGSAYGNSCTSAGKTVQIAVHRNGTSLKIWAGHDESGSFVWQASGDPAADTNEMFDITISTSDVWFFAGGNDGNLTQTIGPVNFGQTGGFTYTPPTGFSALSTANLDTPSITDGSAYFQTTLYTGTGSSLAVTQSGNSTFQPDWVWIKGRSGATEHVLTDAVRGVTKELSTNDAGTEETVAQGLTAFGSSGFTVGTDGSYNTSSATYVGWQWKANGAGSSNTDGSINTTATSVNTTAGFSISTYTGNATVAATVGHGLGVAPKVVIVKSRSNGESWVFGHDSMGWTKAMYMQTTGAPFTLDIYWNNTAPTSSVVELHDHPVTNGSGYTYVMYAFAEIPGYSRFGSYTGNGSTDGPFVYTGFKPAFVMTKRTNAAGDWKMWDNQRGPYNVNGLTLAANSNGAESSGVAQHNDFLSNGFKIRGNDTETNGSGSTYVYMAFAEHPFGGGGAPVTAR